MAPQSEVIRAIVLSEDSPYAAAWTTIRGDQGHPVGGQFLLPRVHLRADCRPALQHRTPQSARHSGSMNSPHGLSAGAWQLCKGAAATGTCRPDFQWTSLQTGGVAEPQASS